ncbi:universal stress protein [Acetobacter thailandicus]|uniref:universal stress protein n=1 Tax=Acetobacter thailandicus TaxID=1502842 RepID=UPI001BAD781B|nr:universal stress protein [Acetobacter thailandicus]MBS1002946.1 universal stress protein [Acetobacter thailandicus]
MRRCLVIVGRPENAEKMLSFVSGIAARLQPDCIDFMALREPPGDGLSLLTESSTVLLREDQADWAEAWRARVNLWRQNLYQAVTDGIFPEINWLAPEAKADVIIPVFGRDADLLILNLPQERDTEHQKQILRSAVFETGRPLLLVPDGWRGSCCDNIMLSWKQSDCARRAFEASRPLLAGAAVHVLVNGEDPWPYDIMPEVNVTDVRVVRLSSPTAAGATILGEARRWQADLIVMGGYKHAALHNRLVSSTTGYVLHNSVLPVFLQH